MCHACIGDKFLAKQVEKEGAQAECIYCCATKSAFTLADLSCRIQHVLKGHFIPVPECDVPEQSRHGRDAEAIIQAVAGIDQDIAADVREYLFNRLGRTVNVAEREENPYNQGMLYLEPEADTSGLRSAWWDFKEESPFPCPVFRRHH